MATDVFSVIGDPSRRRIIEVLASREATVGELVALLDRPQPHISKHLGVLREQPGRYTLLDHLSRHLGPRG